MEMSRPPKQPVSQEIVNIFRNPKIFSELKREISSINRHIRSFEVNHCHRFEDFKDDIPVAITLHVSYHPSFNFAQQLPKEKIFSCFKTTKLENVPIRIIGNIVQ
jgi:hypothetical protein